MAKLIANVKVMRFLYWFTYSEDTIEGQSKKKAYQLFGKDFLKTVEHGSIKCLSQCHAWECFYSRHIKTLVEPELTAKIDDREMFIEDIDYSYYYEQKD